MNEPTRSLAQDPDATLAYDPDRTEPRATGPRPAHRPTVPGYEVLEELGRGGMGVVYKARQARPGRVVALKMILSGLHAAPEEIARFRGEADAVGQLQHPHIVTIYGFGEQEGRPFFTMEYLDGGSLDARLKRGPLPAREAAALVETLARAVHAIHECGVIHRDLKPANVLLTADGAAKISDFGLAKQMDGTSLATASGVLGTPNYMAPEQAEGGAQVGPPADVYGLGAILYEALTGRPPFGGPSKWATLDQVRTQPPPPPRTRQPSVPRDLEAVCLKCLEKDPARRYASALELADDLRRFLDGEATRARPERWPARAWRAARRRPALSFVVALGLLGGLTSLGLFLFGYFTDPERVREQNERDLAAGRPVVLIGESGPPAWFRVRAGGDDTLTSKEPNRAFFVRDYSGIALVELAPNPQRDSYRFRAEVRHEDGVELSTVGIYFGRSQRAADDDPQQYFAALNFSGRNEDLAGMLFLDLNHLGSAVGNVRWDKEQLRIYSLGGKENPPPGADGWRPWAVDVTPECIRVRSGDKCVDEVARGDVNDLAARLTSGAAPAIAPREALGLYVYRGAASFRRVVVEPLPK